MSLFLDEFTFTKYFKLSNFKLFNGQLCLTELMLLYYQFNT